MHGVLKWFEEQSIPVASRQVQRGMSLYVFGEPGSTVFVIEYGSLKSVRSTGSGRLSIVGLHGPGDIIGEASLSNSRRNESAIAFTETRVHVLDRDLLLDAIADAQLLSIWSEFLSGRIRTQQEIISHFVAYDGQRRLAAMLLKMADPDVQPTRDGLTPIRHQLTQEEFASMVGTTRTRVGQFLQSFEKAGMICRLGGSLSVETARLADYLDVG